MGTGLLKPNVSALVGKLYSPDDVRRDAGFSIYYMGINTGAFFAPLICGWLAQSEGFRGILASVGINAGELLALGIRRGRGGHVLRPGPVPDGRKHLSASGLIRSGRPTRWPRRGSSARFGWSDLVARRRRRGRCAWPAAR